MAVFFELLNRRVIPNWRDYKRTIALGELDSTSKIRPDFHVDISKQLRDWQISNSIGTAADLLGSAYLTREITDSRINDASLFILNNKTKASTPLITLAEEAIAPISINGGNPIDSIEIKDVLEIDSEKTFKAFNSLIRKIKSALKDNPYNAISWVELSRLYSVLGQNKQAFRAMQIAVNLSPDNRFVLRSSTRLFIHFDEPDIALHYLRKSSMTKVDPWLLSAHIATSALLDKHQVNANIGKAMITSNKFSDFNITELSSSLATLEFSSGTIKSSKSFFEIAQKSPNDNSLAQLEWISQKDNRFVFNPSLFPSVANSYEALASEQFENGDWMAAAINSIRWFYDMPYSSIPVILGSFICSAFLNDQETAIKLCKLGLIANPQDVTVNNNLIYACCLANRMEEAANAAKNINNFRSAEVTDESIIMLQATMGLFEFRQGNIEEGKRLYKLSIKNTQKIQRKDLELLANINFLRELIINNCPEVEAIQFVVSNTNVIGMKRHIVELREKTIKFYLKKKKHLSE